MKSPQVYELECFTDEGERIEGDKDYMALQPDVDREVQFMEASERICGNPHNYTVRVLRPEEVRERIRAERRQQRAETRRRILQDAMSQVAGPEEIFEIAEFQMRLREQVRY